MIDKNKLLIQLLNMNDEKLIEEFISAYFKYKENLLNFSSPNLSKHKNFKFTKLLSNFKSKINSYKNITMNLEEK